MPHSACHQAGSPSGGRGSSGGTVYVSVETYAFQFELRGDICFQITKVFAIMNVETKMVLRTVSYRALLAFSPAYWKLIRFPMN